MTWLLILLLAIGVALMSVMQEVPVISRPHDDTSGAVYDIEELTAPALAGPMLTFFAYIATRTALSPFILKALIRKNKFHEIRQVASHLPSHLKLLFHPIVRLSQLEYQSHIDLASKSPSKDVMMEGLPSIQTTKPLYRSVMDYHRVYKSSRATPSEVIHRVLEGCERLSHLKIFSSFDPDDVLRQAKAADQRWGEGKHISIFDGVPVAVKEDRPALGHRWCQGGSVCQESLEDDDVVKTLRDAGAIILGLTTMTEGGVTPLGYSRWQRGPFNPYGKRYYPGGSSAGSAVAVSTGLTPFSVGFDGGGSIRIPAAMNGAFGLATTYGRVQFDRGADSSVIKAGTIAANVEDAALAHVLMGQVTDLDHFYSQLYDGGVRGPPPPHIDDIRGSIRGMRLGVFWDHFVDSDPEVVSACAATLDFLKSEGVEIVNITIPHIRELHMSHAVRILSEFGMTWDSKYHDPNVQLEANTDITVSIGKSFSATDIMAAERLRSFGIEYFRNEIFGALKIDAVASPVMGSKVPKPKEGYLDTGENNNALVYKVMRFVPLANLLGLPSISLPAGYEKDTGLPIGFQLMGGAWTESKLLKLASSIELGHLKRRAPETNFFDTLAPWLGE